MKTKRLFLLGLLLTGITAAFSQKYIPEDDIYYQPDDKNPVVEEKKKDKLTENKVQRSLVIASSQDRDVDEYNRRYTLPVDSLLANQKEDAVTYNVVDENGEDGYYLNGFKGSQNDYEYARRLRVFHDPKYAVHISDPAYTDIYFLDSNDWNVYIDDSYAWVTPTWTNPWSWNFNWAPYSYTSFSWRLNPYFSVSWGGWGSWYDPYYSYGWGYPGWGRYPGWGWGGCSPYYGWCNPYWGSPGYYPPHHSRPAYQYSPSGRSSIGSRSSAGRSSSAVSTGRYTGGRSSSADRTGTVNRPIRNESGSTVTTPPRISNRPATSRTRVNTTPSTGSGSTVTPTRPSRGSSGYNPGSSNSYQRNSTGRTSRSDTYSPSRDNSRSSSTPSYNSGRSSSSRGSYSAPSGGGRSSSSGGGGRRGR